LLDSKIVDDADAQVRMAALLAFSEMPVSDQAGAVIFDALKQDRNNKDKWIPHAIISAAAKHDAAFLKAALGGIKLDPSQKIDTTEKLLDSNQPASEQQLENEQNGKPNGWKEARYGGKADYALANIGHTGTRNVRSPRPKGADAAGSLTSTSIPHDYKLSGWIKTENVQTKGNAHGALFNIHQIQSADGSRSKALKAPNDWTHIETPSTPAPKFQTQRQLSLRRLGPRHRTAWYDDVEIVPQGAPKSPPLPGEVGKALQIVTKPLFAAAARPTPFCKRS